MNTGICVGEADIGLPVFYYLHSETKDLICKRTEVFKGESDFVQEVWRLDPSDRKDAWAVILEGLALGASIPRVKELCKKWECDLKDSKTMLCTLKPTKLRKKGLNLYIEKILEMDIDQYFKTIGGN